MSEPLSLSAPVHLRAETARAGLLCHQLQPWESPDKGYYNPLNDPEIQREVKSFMRRLELAACEAEGPL